ncbi:MAG TPA: RNA polymerase sigma factor, partial [Solirubrobacteraceae bacterium]
MSVLQAPSRPTGTPPASSAATDARLLRRLRAGDQSAFEAIFKHHYPPLLSFCRHMLGNQQEAEDTLQQTFLRAHRALLRNSPPRELRPWLYAVARNCCLSAIAARRPTAEFEDGTSLLGLSDQVREREDLRELLADMARLPTAQRSALLLAELDDLSHQEIASIVECPVSKVKALIYQARSSLIAARDARNTPCQDIREQLAVARGGELRRGPLRRHLSQCVGCRDFQEAVSIQRQSLAVLLPVLPSAAVLAKILGGALGSGVMATGTGATAGGGVVAGGSASLAGTTATGATATGAAATVSAGAGTGTGALLGGGVAVKAAVTGALALATVGAVAAHTHFAHANPNKNVRHTQLRSASPRSHGVRRVGGSERSQLATTVPSTGSLTASHGQSPSSIGTNPPEPQAPVGGVPPLTLTAQIPGGSGANALLLAGSSPSLASPSES